MKLHWLLFYSVIFILNLLLKNFAIVELIFCIMRLGPTLLFSRKIDKGDAIDKFYACAAYRKRKDCNFYQKFGPKESEEKQALRKKIYLDFNSSNRLYRNIMEASM